MAGSSEHIKALLRSHAEGDDASFYAVAAQIAALEARKGHNRVAQEIKKTLDASRRQPSVPPVTSIAQPRGDLAELVTAAYPKASLRDLVGPSSLLDSVGQVVTEHRQRSRLTERGFQPIHRVLLEGPPGTGKTMTAGVIASELGVPLFSVRLDGLMSKFLGESATKLRAVFEAAATQRGVFLFDEFDALGADRSGNDVGEARRVLNSFLVFLEDTNSESLIIAATNHRAMLDRALFRRFDLVVSYHLPEAKEAGLLIKRRLGALGQGLRASSLKTHLDGLSHAELVKAAESAAKQSLLRGDSVVSASDLRAALDSRRAAAGA